MVMEEFAAAEEKWAKVTVPNRQEVENIKDYTIYISEKIAQLVETQPRCWELGENYDNVFSEYKAKVEEVSGSNRRALKVVDDSAYAATRVASLRNEIETLRELVVNNREF